MNDFDVLLKLLIAHLAGDFFLQTKTMVNGRNKRILSWALVLHLVIHLICVLTLLPFQLYPGTIIIIISSHGLIDILKVAAQKILKKISIRQNWPDDDKQPWRTYGFLLDQLLHIATLGVVWLSTTGQTTTLINWVPPVQFWLFLFAYLLVTKPAAILIGICMQRWFDQINTGNIATSGLKRAGIWIGVIERVLILTFIVKGKYEAIGFLLAAKSILRIGDLKENREHQKTEYILIGTLLSFGLTILAGITLMWLLDSVIK